MFSGMTFLKTKLVFVKYTIVTKIFVKTIIYNFPRIFEKHGHTDIGL